MRHAGKKGSVLDLIWIGLVLLAFSITVLVGYKIYDSINDEFQASDNLETRGKEASGKVLNLFTGTMDNAFLFLTIGLALVALFMATMVRVHPVFFIFYIIILAFVIFLSGVFSNVYQEVAGADGMELSSNLTFIHQIMTYLPLIIAVFGTLLAMVMYKLWSVANE